MFAILSVCALILLSIALTIAVVRTQYVASRILSLAYEHERVWESLGRDISNTPQALDARQGALLATQVRGRVQAGLRLSGRLTSELAPLIEDRLSLLFAFGDDLSPENLRHLTSVDPRVFALAQRFSTYPEELIAHGVVTWDTEIQALILSGEYLASLRELTATVLPAAKQSLSRASIAIVLINVLVLLGCVLIWRRIIAPAFDTVARMHADSLRAHEAERHQGTMLEAAFESILDPACVVAASGQVVWSNQAFEDFFPDSSPPGEGLTALLASLEAPALDRALAEIEDPREIFERLADLIVSTGNGRSIHFRSAAAGDGWLVMLVDRTALFEPREKMLADEHLRQLGSITGAVAHDFNNVLANVLLRAEMLREEAFTDESARESLTSISEACVSGRALVSQLLSYARHQDLEAKSISADALVERLHRELEAPEPVSLEVRSTTSSWISVDGDFLVSALDNLIENAVEAMSELDAPDAGRWITITFRDATMTTHPCPERAVEISVRDNGAGFGPEALERAFEPFFTTKNRTQGAGLGLSVVEGFVHQCGGDIDILNHPYGAEIRMRFPAEEAPAAPSHDRIDHFVAPTEESRAGRCLLLEDNRDLAKVLEEFLEQLGWAPVSTASIAEVESVLDVGGGFEAAILDWSLPDGTCEAVARFLHHREPEVRIAIITGHGDNRASALCADVGASMLRKPVPLRTLAEALGRPSHQGQSPPANR